MILAYSRRIASDLRAWLLDHEAPATILAASTPEEARPSIGDVDILFGASFPTELLSAAPHLRWIQSMNAGVEELVAAEAIPPTVTVKRVIDQFGKAIAGHVFAEYLAHVRDLDRTGRAGTLLVDLAGLPARVRATAELGECILVMRVSCSVLCRQSTISGLYCLQFCFYRS